MSVISGEKRSQREVFVQATQELSAYNPSITSILIRDIFVAITQSRMVLDGLLIRTNLKSGSNVSIIRSRIRSEYCHKEYYIPVNILYPISGYENDRIRIFLIVSKSTSFFFVISRYYCEQTMQLCRRK